MTLKREHARPVAARVAHPSGLRAEVFGGVGWSIPFIGLLLYMIETTTHVVSIATISVSVAILGVLFQRERVRTPAMFRWLSVYLLWALLGRFGSEYPSQVGYSLFNGLRFLLILFVVLNALRSPKQVQFYMYVVTAAYLLFPVRGAFFNLFLYDGATAGRTAWVGRYANPNDLAGATILALSVAAAVLVGARHRVIRNSAFVGVTMLVLVILMTQSRGAFLGLICFGLLSFSRKRWARSLTIVFLIGGIAVSVVPSGVWTRVAGIAEATDTSQLNRVDEEGSATQRFEIWRTAFTIMSDEPFFGVGLGAAAQAIEEYNPALGARDTHSTFFTILMETGIPGLFFFLGFLGSTLFFTEGVRRRAVDRLPARSRELYLLEAGLLSYLIAGVFGTYGLLPFLYLHAGLLWSLGKVCEGELAGAERARRRYR